VERPTLTPNEPGARVRRTGKAQGRRQDPRAGFAYGGLRFIVDLDAGMPFKVLEMLGWSHGPDARKRWAALVGDRSRRCARSLSGK